MRIGTNKLGKEINFQTGAKKTGGHGYSNVRSYPSVNEAFKSDAGAELDQVDVRLLPSGYSKHPSNYPTYPETLRTFLDQVIEPDTGVITSPTTGTIDETATKLAIDDEAELVHVTSERYFKKYTPAVEEFPEADQAKMAETPKLLLPDKESMLEGVLEASNAALIYGGRGVAVNDFKGSVERGHPTVIALDTQAPEFAWDEYKGNKVPSSASQYIADQIGDEPKLTDPDSFENAITEDWLSQHSDQLGELVKVVKFDGADPEAVKKAGSETLEFLLSRNS